MREVARAGRSAVNHNPDLRLVNEQMMVERALANRDDFEPIYMLYAGPVYRMCLRATGDPDLADDLTAKVFLTVIEKLHLFQPEKGSSFRSWLFAIAQNAVRDHWRRTNRIHRLHDDGFDVVDLSPGPDEIALHRLEFADLKRALERLNDRQRTIIELRLSGLTTTEIADAMGITIPSLKSAQTRAYASLRRYLDHEGGL
ncbi:MAG: sigma-70 family RNA polymerase sigma factor [Thermomicrobiales bacterium]|nr:sigma-70 family RNA polymerase sigma factor [Thermomicrobiales bacterium]